MDLTHTLNLRRQIPKEVLLVAEYVAITDEQAVKAFELLSKTEGIILAIESAHALAHAIEIAPTLSQNQIIVINLSGRGNKDCAAIARYRGEIIHD